MRCLAAAQRVRPVMNELAYNLESFNPAFTAVLLKVQQTIGVSDYVHRDVALKNLIQPLAGEYGMHNDEAQGERRRGRVGRRGAGRAAVVVASLCLVLGSKLAAGLGLFVAILPPC